MRLAQGGDERPSEPLSLGTLEMLEIHFPHFDWPALRDFVESETLFVVMRRVTCHPQTPAHTPRMTIDVSIRLEKPD